VAISIAKFQILSSKDKTEKFWHSSIWISIVIWILTFGLVQILHFNL
jgi:hypothetical protein